MKELLSRVNNDFSAAHSLSSPLSINYGDGPTLRPGTYEKIGGEWGKQASDVLRDLQYEVDHGSRPDIALQKAKGRIKIVKTMLADKPGLVEELDRHLAAIENDFYQQSSKKSRNKNLTDDQREAGRQMAEGFSPQVKPYEKNIGRLVDNLTGGKIEDADFFLRSEIDRITSINNQLRLKYNVKSSAVNLVQPLETLWPRVSTADYARLVAESIKPATRKRLEAQGVISGSSKLESSAHVPADRELAFVLSQDEELMKLANEVESDFAIKEADGHVFPDAKPGGMMVKKTLMERLKSASPFAAASEQNRMMGYLYGEMDAKKRGITDVEQIHKNGLAWAEIVEFDNSTYNAPPVMRDTAAKLLLQYKGFTLKSIENLADLVNAPGSRAERAARVAKWATAKGITGGTKVLTSPIGVAGLATYVTARQMFKDRGMSDEDAQKGAEAIYLGLPALAGADLSSSVSFLDAPFGNTTSEQAVNFAAGPTLSSLLNYGQMARDKKSPLDIAQRVSPYIKQGVAISDIVTGQSPDVMVAKNKQNPSGKRPPTLTEMGLRTLATPLSAQSGGYADKEIITNLQSQAADLAGQLADMAPGAGNLTRDQIKQRDYKIQNLMKKASTVDAAQKVVESLKASLAKKQRLPTGIGYAPTTGGTTGG